jgi:uncharacterized damage-inducible protein DinB
MERVISLHRSETMRRIATTAFCAVAVAMAMPAGPIAAQGRAAGLAGDLQRDIGVLEQKVVSLAEAMPADKYEWTPMQGVRTVAQVYLHIAANNYFFPTMVGVTPPNGSSITTDYQSAVAFEAAGGTKAEIVAKLKDSFAHLKAALGQSADLDKSVNFFGRPATARRVWLETITHIHEHLGQSIAYARSNHVVPPWSR